MVKKRPTKKTTNKPIKKLVCAEKNETRITVWGPSAWPPLRFDIIRALRDGHLDGEILGCRRVVGRR